MANIKSIYGNPVVDDSLRKSVAAEYSSSSTYAVGDIVLKDGALYKCSTAISTAEAWNSAHWTADTVGSELSQLKEDITNIQNATLITDTASGAIASFPDGAAMPVKDLTVSIEPVQSGSGDPSPTNIRPISGWTQAKVTRTGKNLFDVSWDSGVLSTTIGADINAVTSSSRYAHSSIYQMKDQVCVSIETLDTSKIEYFGVLAYVNDKLVWQNGITLNASNKTKTWTIPANTYEKLRLNIGAPSGVNADATNVRLQIELGSTATTYEPYNGQQYTIDLNGTRYGGTLDVTTGVLTVDRAMVDMGSLDWLQGVSLHNIFYASISGCAIGESGKTQCMTSMYKAVNSTDFANLAEKCVALQLLYGTVGVSDSSYANASAFKIGVTGQTLVYELAEPITVQLTAQEITTLLGQNNIYADCGDSAVEYRADTKLYINKVLNA